MSCRDGSDYLASSFGEEQLCRVIVEYLKHITASGPLEDSMVESPSRKRRVVFVWYFR
jgi:hypothetical protein